MPDELTFTLQQRDGARAVVLVAGAMDFDTSPPLRQSLAALIEDGAVHLVLDMAAVAFCDSSGLNILLQVLRQARTQGGSLSLAATGPRLDLVLRISGADSVIPRYPSTTLALDNLPG
jgi:anti-sigma B factor antagonist